MIADDRGFFFETFRRERVRGARRRRGVRAGQPLALGARARCARSTSSSSPARRSWSARARGVDLRRRGRPAPRLAHLRPVRGVRADATRTPASSSCRSASRTASASRARRPTSTYKVSSYYDGATERGIAFDDPAIGVPWPVERAARLGARPHQPDARGDRRRASLVSGSNLERARRGWDALNRGDLDDGAVATSIPTWSGGRRRVRAESRARSTAGKEAYERWLREELPEVWEEFRGEDLEFRELPDGRVLLLGYIAAAAARSGVEVRCRSASWRGSGRPGGAAPRVPGPRERRWRPRAWPNSRPTRSTSARR